MRICYDFSWKIELSRTSLSRQLPQLSTPRSSSR